VAAPAGQPLEALFRNELRGPVSELVRRVAVELVPEQLNAHAPSLGPPAVPSKATRRPGPTPKPAPAERRCNRCGETKPADEYARGRGTCRSCRRAQQREHDRRVALAEDEEPHPATGDACLAADRAYMWRASKYLPRYCGGRIDKRRVSFLAAAGTRAL
jgi:hypothetical protein